MNGTLASGRSVQSRVLFVLLVFLFFARGVVLLCVLPPFEMWDEYSHVAHVDFWAVNHTVAVYGRAGVEPAFLAAASAFPQPRASGFGRSYAAFWGGGAAGPVPAGRGLYEAQQPFLYYATAAPIYRACGGRSNLPAAISALRLLNLACGTGAVALVLNWLRRHVAGDQALILGCWVALQPLLLLNVVRVANDALAFLLGTIVVVCSLELSEGWTWSRRVAFAVVVPLAILAKATNVVLVPVVAVSLCVAVGRRAVRARTAVGMAGLMFVVTAVALGPYVAFNLRTFGVTTPMQEAVANRVAGRSAWTLVTGVPLARWPVLAASWWVVNGLWVGGWSFLQPPRLFEVAYAGLLLLVGVGVVMQWRRRLNREGATARRAEEGRVAGPIRSATVPSRTRAVASAFPSRPRALAVQRLPPDVLADPVALPGGARWVMVATVACVQAGLMVHAAESFGAWNGRVFTNSWYAAVAVPWWLILLGAGGLSIGARRVRWFVMVGVPVLFISTETFGVLFRMIPAYYVAPSLSLLSLRRMGLLHPVLFGPGVLIGSVLGIVIAYAVVGRRILDGLN